MTHFRVTTRMSLGSHFVTDEYATSKVKAYEQHRDRYNLRHPNMRVLGRSAVVIPDMALDKVRASALP